VEAIACGTPVIAFPTGGLRELVQPGRTGWLASDNTAAALAASIDEALTDLAEGADLRETCRAVAETNYSLEQQARQYLALFGSLLSAVSAAMATSLVDVA
jgi:glycosyltransferase involved in cell wall biosynthesis